ncbi:phage tail assembly chaperone [Desulfovibrio piger]
MPVFYSPKGNPEIWAQKPDGYFTPEEWAAAHPAPAPVPPTEAELFQRLRTDRDRRLAATDYLLMPDYPLDDTLKGAVQLYRQALRDLPAQSGAPWDGGGEATPWPEIPSVLQEQQGSSTSSVYTPGVM